MDENRLYFTFILFPPEADAWCWMEIKRRQSCTQCCERAFYFVAQFTHDRAKRLDVCGELWLWYELEEITITFNMTRLLLLFSLLSFQCHFISNKKKCSTAEMCLSSCFTSSTENYHQRKWGKSKPGKRAMQCVRLYVVNLSSSWHWMGSWIDR